MPLPVVDGVESLPVEVFFAENLFPIVETHWRWTCPGALVPYLISEVHANLHAENIIFDGTSNLFVIDMGNSGPGHSLSDCAHLEANIPAFLSGLSA
jgi:hypothetical protein